MKKGWANNGVKKVFLSTVAFIKVFLWFVSSDSGSINKSNFNFKPPSFGSFHWHCLQASLFVGSQPRWGRNEMKNAKVRFTFMGIRVPGLHYPLGQQGVKNIRAVNDRMRNAFCCYSLQLNPNYYLIPLQCLPCANVRFISAGVVCECWLTFWHVNWIFALERISKVSNEWQTCSTSP